MTNRSKILAAVAVVVVLGAAAAGGLYWFLRDDAPAEVDLSTAAESVTTTSSATDGSASSAEPDAGAAGEEPAASGDIAGSWVVDTETGEFDYESATGSFAGFRIQEELAGIGSTTAVGRTGDVGGRVEIEGTAVTAAAIEIDLTTITTNESRRDGAVQRALETDEHPTATFTLTEPIELGEGAGDGEAVAVDAVGDLTVHGVTRAVVVPMEAQLVGDHIVAVGSVEISFADHDVQVPSAQIVLSVEEHGTIELQLLLARA